MLSRLKEILQVLRHLPKELKFEFKFLTFAFMVTGAIQAISILTIAPFTALVISPEKYSNHPIAQWIFDNSNLSTQNDLIIFAGIFTTAIFVIPLIINMFLEWRKQHWFQNAYKALLLKLFNNIINREFSYFATRHSAEILQHLQYETHKLIYGIVKSFMEALFKTVNIIILLTTLVIVAPMISLLAFSLFAITYIVILKSLNKRLQHYGTEIRLSNERRYKTLQEILSGIKETKVCGTEDIAEQKVDKISQRFALASARSSFIKWLPKPVIETIFMSSMIFAISIVALQNDGVETLLPKMTIFLFAGYRILPNAQSVFQSLANIKLNTPFMNNFLKEISRKTPDKISPPPIEVVETLRNFSNISLKNVDYKYPNNEEKSLSDISLNIKRNECIGIVGESGAGKSTLIDLILGLNYPTHGHFEIDGKSLSISESKAWRQQIGYVSQNFFILDNTIAHNIAFGEKNPDMKRVIEVAKMAALDPHINQMSDGYKSYVGEGGARLSGGQKQRLAIARALYNNPKVLLLDEATSALDNETEAQIMADINKMVGNRTIIIIAHRLNTLTYCERIINLKKGRITHNQTTGN